MRTFLFLRPFFAFLLLGLPQGRAVHASPGLPADSLHFCLPFDFEQWQRDQPRSAAKRLADLDTGEPRTVRLVYFLPNDRPYRPEAVESIKSTVRRVQTFYSEQMQAHGYGNRTFQVEVDSEGEPVVHRVDGQHPDSQYSNDPFYAVFSEIGQVFDTRANVYLAYIDNSLDSRSRGGRSGKVGGGASFEGAFPWKVAAHELGHAFGLHHDFRDDTYIMSYGGAPDRLSACAAEFLAVHPYFNPEIPIEEGRAPTVELLSSPQFSAGGTSSFSVQLKVDDPDGLHQVILFLTTEGAFHWGVGYPEVKACHGFQGETESVVELDFEDVTPTYFISSVVRPVHAQIIDTDGNVRWATYDYAESSPYHIATLAGHERRVEALSFSSDGATLASGSQDGTVQVWDIETETVIASHPGYNPVAFSPDGTILAVGDGSGIILRGQTDRYLSGHTAVVKSVSFSPDGVVLASGAGDETVRLWDVAAAQEIATLQGHTGEVASVSFSHDGDLLASAGGGREDPTILIWDVATQTEVARLTGHTGRITSVTFSPDGATVASGSGDRTVRLWEVATGREVSTLIHTKEVTAVSFSPDGAILASGSDKTVRLWDYFTEEGQELFALGHPSRVTAVSFSPEATLLASGLWDGKIKLWDVSEWELCI